MHNNTVTTVTITPGHYKEGVVMAEQLTTNPLCHNLYIGTTCTHCIGVCLAVLATHRLVHRRAEAGCKKRHSVSATLILL